MKFPFTIFQFFYVFVVWREHICIMNMYKLIFSISNHRTKSENARQLMSFSEGVSTDSFLRRPFWRKQKKFPVFWWITRQNFEITQLFLPSLKVLQKTLKVEVVTCIAPCHCTFLDHEDLYYHLIILHWIQMMFVNYFMKL